MVTANVVVKEMRREISADGLSAGWYAKVITVDGERLDFSLLDHESVWICDAQIRRTGFPVFVGGFGARCSKLQQAGQELSLSLFAAMDEVSGR